MGCSKTPQGASVIEIINQKALFAIRRAIYSQLKEIFRPDKAYFEQYSKIYELGEKDGWRSVPFLSSP